MFFNFRSVFFFNNRPKNDCKTTNRKGSSSGRFAVTNLKKDQCKLKKKVHSSDQCIVCGIMKTIDITIWSVAWLVFRAVNFEHIQPVVWSVASAVFAVVLAAAQLARVQPYSHMVCEELWLVALWTCRVVCVELWLCRVLFCRNDDLPELHVQNQRLTVVVSRFKSLINIHPII